MQQGFLKISFITAVTLGLMVSLSLGACSKKNGNDSDLKDIAGQPGEAVPGDFPISAMDPNTGKVGDLFTVTGEGLNPDTDLILFGDKVVIPISKQNNGRQFLQAAKEEVNSTKNQLVGRVPEGVCNQEYQVCVVRKELTSTCLKYIVIETKDCQAPEGDGKDDEKKEPAATEGIAVKGGEGNGGNRFRPQAVPVNVYLTASRNPVYSVLRPETILEWGVIRGAVDAISLTANGQPVAELTQVERLTGSVMVTPEVTTTYELTVFYHGEVRSVENNTVTVQVIGAEDIEDLDPLIDMDVSPRHCVRDASNNFTCPEVTVRYVTNKLQGGEVVFSFTEECEQDPCASIELSRVRDSAGEFTFTPDKTGLLAAQMIMADGEVIDSLSGPIRVEVTLPQVDVVLFDRLDWHTRKDHDDFKPGYARVRVKLKNIFRAPLSGLRHLKPCIKEGADCVSIGQHNIYQLPVIAGEVDVVFYTPQNCGDNEPLCTITLDITGIGSDHQEEGIELTYDNLRPKKELFQVKLRGGDWPTAEVNYRIKNALYLEVTDCHGGVLVREENYDEIKEADLTFSICSSTSGLNTSRLIARSYFDRESPGSHRISILETERAREGPDSAWGAIIIEPVYDDTEMAGATNQALVQYRFRWFAYWAKTAKIVGTSAAQPHDTCFERDLNLHYRLQSRARRSGGLHYWSEVSDMFTIEAHPLCHDFKMIVTDIEGREVEMTPFVPTPKRVTMSLRRTEFINHNTMARYRKWFSHAVGHTHYHHAHWCDPQWISNKFRIEVNNGQEYWFEGGSHEGKTYVCPYVNPQKNPQDVFDESLARMNVQGSPHLDDERGQHMVRELEFNYRHKHLPGIPPHVQNQARLPSPTHSLGCRLVVQGTDGQTYRGGMMLFPNEHPTEVWPNSCGGRKTGNETKGEGGPHN
jgi:hypothetical protein